ncbi:MAG: ATP-binding protein [Oscillospiraceae bacterium]|nr:ATP-binding protein [Oscillospiraceae bacterium]
MSYDPNVLQRASRRLEEQRRERARRTEQRRTQIYAQQPRLAQIDRELRATMTGVVTAALRRGEDPAPALAQLRAKNLDLQDERNLLLGTMGLAPSDLDDTPACPLCGDSGWKGTQMCECLHRLCTQEQISALSDLLKLGEQTFDSFRFDYYGTIPDLAAGISPRDNMENVIFPVCLNYARTFGQRATRNLFLYGAPGLGKTFLSACIARAVSEQGHSVVYDTAGNIFARFEDQKFGRDPEARDETRRYLNCDLLIVDDLGSELTTPLSQSSLYTVINTRLTSNKHTIISSNLSMDEVARRYSPQIASRLEGEYHALHFFGEDIRKQKKNML